MKTTNRQAGFSLIELLIVLAVIAVLAAIAIPMMREALVRAHIGAAAAEARAIHSAFKAYHVDQSVYPDPALFDVATMEPLVSLGYYDGRILPRVKAQVLDGYDAPSTGEEYWVEFSLLYDPTIRFLVADSNDAPLSGGSFYDGIGLFKNGVLTPL